jgi:hypothetical protein
MNTTTSWKSLLFKALFGAGLFALANVAVYHASEYFRMARMYDATLQGALEKRNLETVLIGDSHTATLRNAFLADGVYNLAYGGDGPREMYAKLRRVLSANDSVKTVMLSADVHMFGEARQASSNRAFADLYLLETASPYGLEHGRLSAVLNAVPLLNDDFVQFMKKSVSSHHQNSPTDQAHVNTATWAERSEQFRSELAESTGRYDHRGAGHQSQAVSWYAHIVDLAHAHGVKIITLRYPAHPGYFASVQESTVKAIDSELGNLGLPPPLDYRRSISDPALFKDEDHLNDSGALVLLQRLEHDTGIRLRNQMLAGYRAQDLL